MYNAVKEIYKGLGNPYWPFVSTVKFYKCVVASTLCDVLFAAYKIHEYLIRDVNQGDQVRRRRECNVCKERFTTFEVAELALPRVVKRDGTREPFDEKKLRSGMLKALEKRPVGSDAIEDAINRIKRVLVASGERNFNPGIR